MSGNGFQEKIRDLRSARDNFLSHNALQACLGSAVYFQHPVLKDHLGILDYSSGDITKDHHSFLDETFNAPILRARTSVDETLSSKQAGIYSSRMAEHDCINIPVQFASETLVVQLVFAEGQAPNIKSIKKAFEQSDYKKAMNALFDEMSLEKISQEIGLRNLEDKSWDINGVVIACDINSSTEIAKLYGREKWDAHLRAWQEDISDLAENLGCWIDKSTGDGVNIVTDHQRDVALVVAERLQQAYEQRRSDDNVGDAETSLRIMLSAGHITATYKDSPGVLSPRRDLNGLPFLQAARGIELLPKKSVIALTDLTVGHFEGEPIRALPLRSLKTSGSTWTRNVQEYIPVYAA